MWRLSPLHHAALSGNKDLISLLLEAQAAVDIKDHKGKIHTDFHWIHLQETQRWLENKTVTKKKTHISVFPCVAYKTLLRKKRWACWKCNKITSVYYTIEGLWEATDLCAQQTIDNRRGILRGCRTESQVEAEQPRFPFFQKIFPSHTGRSQKKNCKSHNRWAI